MTDILIVLAGVAVLIVMVYGAVVAFRERRRERARRLDQLDSTYRSRIGRNYYK